MLLRQNATKGTCSTCLEAQARTLLRSGSACKRTLIRWAGATCRENGDGPDALQDRTALLLGLIEELTDVVRLRDSRVFQDDPTRK